MTWTSNAEKPAFYFTLNLGIYEIRIYWAAKFMFKVRELINRKKVSVSSPPEPER